jgi:RNA-binding protein 26
LTAEQKVLLKRTEGASKEEKMKLLGRLRELSKEMEELDKPKPETKVEGSEKERLDSELARLGMETTAGKDQDELMKLNAQLSALKDKVS